MESNKIEGKQEKIIIETESEVNIYNGRVLQFGFYGFMTGFFLAIFFENLRDNSILFSVAILIMFMCSSYLCVKIYTDALEEH